MIDPWRMTVPHNFRERARLAQHIGLGVEKEDGEFGARAQRVKRLVCGNMKHENTSENAAFFEKPKSKHEVSLILNHERDIKKVKKKTNVTVICYHGLFISH